MNHLNMSRYAYGIDYNYLRDDYKEVCFVE
jgi:hypothetical protein